MHELDEKTQDKLREIMADLEGAMRDYVNDVANYQQDLNNDLYEDPEWEGTVDQTRMEEQIGYLNDAVRYMEDAGSAIYDALGA